jgi:hypothetical protein
MYYVKYKLNVFGINDYLMTDGHGLADGALQAAVQTCAILPQHPTAGPSFHP